MTEPARPQPVVKASRAQGLFSAAAFAVGGLVLVVSHGINAGNLLSVSDAVGTAGTAAVSLCLYLHALWTGKEAAAQVTPLESPQTYGGQKLLTDEQWAAQYGRHAKQPEAPAVQQEPDEAWTAEIRNGLEGHL